MDWERTDEGRKLFNEAWQDYGRDADMALAEWCAKAEAVADFRETELAQLRKAIREWESGATVACNLLSSPSGADRRHEVVSHLNRTHEKARALTEGKNDDG
jgi:hypothetical protein